MTPILALLALVPNPPYAAEVVNRWRALDVEVDLVTYDCGEVNAYYDSMDNRIELCTELVALGPDITRAVINHEMAHAFFDQWDLDIADEELMADEMGWFFMTEEESLAIETWMLRMAEAYPGPQGDHPTWLVRAGALLCLDSGNDPAYPECQAYFRSAAAKWSLIIDLAE